MYNPFVSMDTDAPIRFDPKEGVALVLDPDKGNGVSIQAVGTSYFITGKSTVDDVWWISDPSKVMIWEQEIFPSPYEVARLFAEGAGLTVRSPVPDS